MADLRPWNDGLEAVSRHSRGVGHQPGPTRSGNRAATIARREADVVGVEQSPRRATQEAGAWRGGEGVVYIRFVVRNLQQVLATWMRPSGLQARFYCVQLHGTSIFVPPELARALCSERPVIDEVGTVLTEPEAAAACPDKPVVGFYTHRMPFARSREEAIRFALEAVLDVWRHDPLYRRCNKGRLPDLAVEKTFRPRAWSALRCAKADTRSTPDTSGSPQSLAPSVRGSLGYAATRLSWSALTGVWHRCVSTRSGADRCARQLLAACRQITARSRQRALGTA